MLQKIDMPLMLLKLIIMFIPRGLRPQGKGCLSLSKFSFDKRKTLSKENLRN